MKAVITGTSSGLGKSLVTAFKRVGYETIGISRSKSPETDYLCNFQSNEQIKQTFEKLLSDTKSIDYLILNAGILGTIEKASKINNLELAETFQVNLFSNKLMLDLIINSNTELKNVILISSGASLKAYDGWLSYCLTKSCINQLSRCYALENPSTKFLSLAPGIIQTKMQDQIIKNSELLFSSISKFKSLYNKNPTPDFIANKIVNNLHALRQLESGDYFDLRSIDD